MCDLISEDILMYSFVIDYTMTFRH